MLFRIIGSSFLSSIFEAATKVTSVFALGAFVVAGVVSIIFIVRGRRGIQGSGSVPTFAWIVLIVAVCTPVLGAVLLKWIGIPYRVTVYALDSEGTTAPDAQITSPGIQAYSSNGAYTFEISDSAPGSPYTFYATRDGQHGFSTIKLGTDHYPRVPITLQGAKVLPVPVPTKIEPVLFAKGFDPPHVGDHSPGCDCGPDGISIDPSSQSVKLGATANFKWDAHWICKGQGFKNFEGRVWWDNETASDLPDNYGTATVQYPRPGNYKARLEISASCLDRSNGGAYCWPDGHTCRAKVVASIDVTPR